MPHISPDADTFRPCIVIPVFNHGGAIAGVIDRLRSFGLPCWLIDDGSSADCATILDALAGAESSWVHLERLPLNQGKGAAFRHGLATLAGALRVEHEVLACASVCCEACCAPCCAPNSNDHDRR